MGKKGGIIIGASPAGLTAAFGRLKKTDSERVIFETSGDLGGISKETIWAVDAERRCHEQREDEDRPSTVTHRRQREIAVVRSL